MKNELVDTILARGITNVRFVIPLRPMRVMLCIAYTSSSDETEPVECRIIEDQYKVADNYKIELEPIDYPKHPRESFYISDLVSLMERNPDDFQMRICETI